jgi:hypothetical protein
LKKIAILIILFGCNYSQNHNTNYDIKRLPIGTGGGSVEVADFNQDGKLDIAVANTTDSSVTILLNKGNRTFDTATFFAGQSPNDINIADYNKDGNLDIAFANHEQQYLSVLLGNGKGGFSPAPNSPIAVQVKPHTHGIISADFNKDGNLDVATDSWEVDSIVVLYGDGRGNFPKHVYYATGKRPYQRLRTADVNQDGNPDIVTTNLDGNSATVLLGDGKGGFSSSLYDAGNSPFGVAIGDLNHDGHLDLAVINSPTISSKDGTDGLTILMGNGQGKFTRLKGSPFETGLGPTRVAIGDLNHDGYNDIVVTNFKDNFLSVFYMGPEGVTRTEQIPFGMHADGLVITDIDGDGKQDIIASSPDHNQVVILFGK